MSVTASNFNATGSGDNVDVSGYLSVVSQGSILFQNTLSGTTPNFLIEDGLGSTIFKYVSINDASGLTKNGLLINNLATSVESVNYQTIDSSNSLTIKYPASSLIRVVSSSGTDTTFTLNIGTSTNPVPITAGVPQSLSICLFITGNYYANVFAVNGTTISTSDIFTSSNNYPSSATCVLQTISIFTTTSTSSPYTLIVNTVPLTTYELQT